nr:PREDICTED: C-type lectin domain family 7 member A-like [Phalacrocorax carbo]
MASEEVTYADLRFMTLEKSQDQKLQTARAKGHKCIPCPENWLQYGESCYHFSKQWKTWEESKAQCSALESRLLKIESKEELDFAMRSAQSYSSYSFWIGLSRNGTERPWLWEDGSAFSPDLFQIQRASSISFLDCVWLQGANIDTARCGEYKFYICEKVVDPSVAEQDFSSIIIWYISHFFQFGGVSKLYPIVQIINEDVKLGQIQC